MESQFFEILVFAEKNSLLSHTWKTENYTEKNLKNKFEVDNK